MNVTKAIEDAGVRYTKLSHGYIVHATIPLILTNDKRGLLLKRDSLDKPFGVFGDGEEEQARLTSTLKSFVVPRRLGRP